MSTVVLIATFVADDDTFVTSVLSRAILSLPLAYVIADMAFLTESQALVDIFSAAVLITFPYALYVIAELLGSDYFRLPRMQQLVATATIVAIALLGLYVGKANDRFLTCDDFERIGDSQPVNCQP